MFLLLYFRRYIAFFLLLCCLTQAKAQTYDLTNFNFAASDALAQLTKIQNNTTGEQQADATISIATLHWHQGRYDQALAILAPLKQSQWPKITIMAWFEESLIAQNRNHYAEAERIMLEHVHPLVNLNLTLFTTNEQANFYRMTGIYQRNLSKYDLAKQNYQISLELYSQSNRPSGMARIYNALGVLAETELDYDQALMYQLNAMHALSNSQDLMTISANFYNLGNLYMKTNDLTQAEHFYQKALKIDLARKNSKDCAFDYSQLAKLAHKKGQLKVAIEYNEKAIELFLKADAPAATTQTYLQLADIYKDLANPTARFANLNHAQNSAMLTNDTFAQGRVHSHFFDYYLENNVLNQALSHAEQYLAITQSLNNISLVRPAHEKLADVLALKQDFSAAYSHLKLAYQQYQEDVSSERIKEQEKSKKDVNLLQEQLKVSQLQQNEKAQQQIIATEQATKKWLVTLFFLSLLLFSVIIFNIWQRRKMALLRNELSEQLLKQKDQLLADISHELRTPLTSMKLQVNALQHNLISDVQSSYSQMNQKVIDINRLISDIYELAQSDSGHLVLNQQSHVAATLFESWQHEFANYVKDHDFNWQYEINLQQQTVLWDCDRIKQVLTNLIANSCLYTDKPGTITLSVYAKNHFIIISINDTAPGVPSDQFEQIFERLYRVEKSRSRQLGGSGLGLAICKNLIHAHQGQIRATASPLGGLKISIKLPVCNK